MYHTTPHTRHTAYPVQLCHPFLCWLLLLLLLAPANPLRAQVSFGTENKPAGIPAGYGVRTYELADLDNDGDDDLVIGHDDGVIRQENNGNGFFLDAYTYNITYNNLYLVNNVILKDFDNDMDIDITIADTKEITLFRNMSSNNFSLWQSRIVSDMPNMPINQTQIADMDGDGDIDFVQTCLTGYDDDQQLAWYANNNSYSIGGSQYIVPTDAVYSNGSYFTIADFDGDSDQDVVASVREPNGFNYTYYLKIFINNGLGVFTPIDTMFLAGGDLYSNLYSDDNDNDIDLVHYLYTRRYAEIFLRT